MPDCTQRLHQDRPRLESMASGHLTLVLRDNVDWSAFESFAKDFLSVHGGEALSRADTPVERVWTVQLRGVKFWLSFDDFHNRYELNARDDEGDKILSALAADFSKDR